MIALDPVVCEMGGAVKRLREEVVGHTKQRRRQISRDLLWKFTTGQHRRNWLLLRRCSVSI